MSLFTVKPTFKSRRLLTLPASSMNGYMGAEIQGNTGFYQRRFGVFSHMKLNDYKKFILHSMSGNPFMWQPHRNCSFDPLGHLSMDRREVEPCRAKINSEFCQSELFDSCFKHLLRWDGSSPVRLDATATALINDMVRIIAENATLGARLTLTIGQNVNPEAVNFKPTTPIEVQDLFKSTIGTCRGWLELLRMLGAGEAPQCNVPVFSDSQFDSQGRFLGDPLEIYDALFSAGTVELQQMINEGGLAGTDGNSNFPIFVVSTSIFNKIAQDYNAQCLSNTCLNPRLTRESENRAGAARQHIYYIDSTPVIPEAHISYMDRYLTGKTHFAGLMAAGNIALGSSFDDIPDLTQNNVGIMIERGQSVKDLGYYYFLAHALFSVQINDTTMISATQAYVEP